MTCETEEISCGLNKFLDVNDFALLIGLTIKLMVRSHKTDGHFTHANLHICIAYYAYYAICSSMYVYIMHIALCIGTVRRGQFFCFTPYYWY